MYISVGGIVTRAVNSKQARWDEPTQLYVPDGGVEGESLSCQLVPHRAWARKDATHVPAFEGRTLYWPNMCADTEKVKYCAECQFFANKKS